MSKPTFTYSTCIKLRDADPAGVLFFANYFALAHDAYEAFMEHNGVNLAEQIRDGRYLIPVVHAGGDFRAPLWAGEQATITLTVEEVRRRIFTIAYEFRNAEGRFACSIRTVHVVVDTQVRRAVPLPEMVVQALRNDE